MLGRGDDLRASVMVEGVQEGGARSQFVAEEGRVVGGCTAPRVRNDGWQV